MISLQRKSKPPHPACLPVKLARMPFSPQDFDEVIAGCVMPGPDETNIARVVALRLGCGEQTPAWTVQRNCASGLQALDCAARNIVAGRSELVLAGGIEAMSHAPVLFSLPMVEWLGEWARAKSFGARVKVLTKLRGTHLTPIIGLLRVLPILSSACPWARPRRSSRTASASLARIWMNTQYKVTNDSPRPSMRGYSVRLKPSMTMRATSIRKTTVCAVIPVWPTWRN